MSKKVVTEVNYSYATFSGNVSDINVKTDYVPDVSDYNELKSKLNNLQDKVETIEELISSLKDFISIFTREVEKNNHYSMHRILEILTETENNIAHLIKS